MRVKHSLVVQALKRHARWLRKFAANHVLNSENRRRVHDVVVWCLDFVELSPTTNLAAWLSRRARRKLLEDPVRAAHTERGRKAILDLIELAVSEVGACAAFLPQIDAGLLPCLRAPSKVTAIQIAALTRGRNTQNTGRRKHREAVAKRAAEMAIVQ